MNYSTYIKEKLVSLINEMDHYPTSVWILQRIHPSTKGVHKYCLKPLNFCFGSLLLLHLEKNYSVDIACWPVTDQICVLHTIRRMKQHIFNPHQTQKALIKCI